MKKFKRPWGYYQELFEEPGVKVKKLVISPGQRISLQTHKYREEVWSIIDGRGLFEGERHVFNVKPGRVIKIPKRNKHRIENKSKKKDLIIFEIQRGNYLGEDDIVRYSDDYKRI